MRSTDARGRDRGNEGEKMPASKSGVPFTTPDPSLAPGTWHAGFTVRSVEPLEELGGTAYVMRHDASGARLMWLAVPDDNKSFSIAFKTPPKDDTGVFHILEHSVLCGSDRYPVKEPFVNLIKSSMQTFLNAITFPDKTMYPVASTNVADLENLMGVYLDAVLHPSIWRRRRIFEQEGWHLEPTEDDGLAYNGVVYNEMRGATSDPDDVLFQALDRQLFPTNAYRFDSGGDPSSIPDLSYEGFLDSHARHYALPNSYTVLYGDLDIERELAFIAERFDGAEDRHAGAPNPLEPQEPVRPALAKVRMATAPGNAAVGLSYVIGTAGQRERVLAADVLLDALCGSNEAPLKRAVLQSGLADEFQGILVDGELQPQVAFHAKGTRPDSGPALRELVEGTCARLVRDGIGRERLEASLAQAEFNLREGDWGYYADGVALSMQAMSSWLYDDGRPVDYLRFQDCIDSMREGLADGYFERLLDELVCHSAHNAEVELVPVEDGAAADEAARLAELRAGMDDEAYAAVASELEALRREQEAPDDPADVARLPRLGVADIAEAPAEPREERVEAPLPCVWHDIPTHRIDYVYHYFDLRRLTADELPYASVLAELLGRLGTREHSAAELDTLVEGRLGSLDFFCDSYAWQGSLDEARPYLVVGVSSLSERVADAATIPAEVWGSTLFDDQERILAILQQRRIALSQYFQNNGHAAAMARLSTHYSRSATAADALGGVGLYLFLRELLASWDERKNELCARLADVARRVFSSDEVLVSFTGPRADLDAFWAAGGSLGLSPAGDAAAHRLELPAPKAQDEAFLIASNVSYVGEGAAPSAADAFGPGSWAVASRALSFDYLWNEVRMKGGAYGVGFRRTTSGLPQFWSYRDPVVTPSIARYEGSADWLRSWDASQAELEGYVVSCVAAHDNPVKPRQLVRRQDGLDLSGRPEGWRAELRGQILGTTQETLRSMATCLDGLEKRRSLCVFGPQEQVEGSGLTFDQVIDLRDAAVENEAAEG